MNRSKYYIIIILIISVLLFGGYYLLSPKGSTVYIQVDGQMYGEYPLSKNQEIYIDLGGGDYNRVKISDNKVDMIESTCPNQICVNDAPLVEGEPRVIVCLPHEIIIEIK